MFVLIYILHTFGWFCFGAMCAMIQGRGAMKMTSAFALGVISGSAQLIGGYLGYW